MAALFDILSTCSLYSIFLMISTEDSTIQIKKVVKGTCNEIPLQKKEGGKRYL